MADAGPRGSFGRQHRIRKRPEFLTIQASERRVVTRHFLIMVTRCANGVQGPRLGITASRRVGGAVVRNRAKRLVREAFRATRELWPAHLDIVVIVRGMEPDMKLAAVIKEWRAAKRFIGKHAEALRAGSSNTLEGDHGC